MPFGEIESWNRDDGVRLAFERQTGAAPTFVWLSGFRSDMGGTKAEALALWAQKTGQSFLRLDYSGHGRSGGRFEDGCISAWRDDALALIDRFTDGPLVLVGSSMGGWIALLIALARRERVKGLVLIAPAPDFTQRLMWPAFPGSVQRQILEQGRWDMPSAYDPAPTPITRRLIEDGADNLLLDGSIVFHGPVRMLHGADDPDVPWSTAVALAGALETGDLQLTKIPQGDHRLSRPEDLALLTQTAAALAEQLAGELA